MTNLETSSQSPIVYRDRRTGLIVFGVLTICIGAVVALFIPLVIFAAAMSAKEPALGDTYKAVIPAIVIYGLLAVALIWLGIGSVMARRWARALLLIFSWCWLIVGVISVAGMAFMMPKAFASNISAQQAGQPQMPAATQSIILAITLIFFGIIFILLPAIWVWFYQSKNVKMTCEARDPVTRWTDRCPLPVLAISLWLGFGALTMFALPFAYHGVFPFFGMLLFGIPGTAIYIVLALIWAYSAWTLFRLKLHGWWLIVVTLGVWSISSVLTYLRHDLQEMYQRMGYSDQQLAAIQHFGLLKGHTMAWSSLLFMVPFLAYLLFIRRYFRRAVAR